MTRRSIFKGFVACVAASAMEVCGWKAPKLFGGLRGSFDVEGIAAMPMWDWNSASQLWERRKPTEYHISFPETIETAYRNILRDGNQ